jgi:hypothetical protein
LKISKESDEMTGANGKGEARRNYADSAWTALDHEGALRAEGRRYRPARLYDRPQLSERETACKPQHSIWESWTKTQPGIVVVGKGQQTRPGRASPAKRPGDKRQTDLFE